MATTYKDYYINYNGTRISNNEDTGLTAVNIYYNGTYLGEGAHTLNCAGQYMNGNVTIGARTLNCGGQYMNGNVQVLTQNRYKWYKYYAPIAYSMSTIASYSVSAGGDVVYVAPTYSNVTCYRKATGYSFNSSNGHYSLWGGEQTTIGTSSSGSWGITEARNYAHSYSSVPGQTSDCTEMWDSWLTNAQYPGTGTNSSNCFFATGNPNVGYTYLYTNYMQDTGEGRRYGSSSYYYRGDYITTVSSTNASAYPTDARAGDGYWYVAV